jgi:hypothetical protein
MDVYEDEGPLLFSDLSSTIIQDDVFERLTTFPNVVITGHGPEAKIRAAAEQANLDLSAHEFVPTEHSRAAAAQAVALARDRKSRRR